MDITTLENWLWEAACSIRGPLDAPKYKDYILPLLFYKRLSDVYEDEVRRLREELGDEAMARQLARQDRVLTRFYIPNGYTWPEVRKSTARLGERLTEAMREIANKERDIRRTFVEGDLVTPGDLVEAVILLPENLFYNTTAPGIIMVINKAKPHPGEILLINASKLCAKGRPKNYLTDEHIRQIHEIYRDWRAEAGVSAIITTAEAARNDYNLSPSRYVASNDQESPLPLEETLVLLAQAEEERTEADAELDAVLTGLGFEGWREG